MGSAQLYKNARIIRKNYTLSIRKIVII